MPKKVVASPAKALTPGKTKKVSKEKPVQAATPKTKAAESVVSAPKSAAKATPSKQVASSSSNGFDDALLSKAVKALLLHEAKQEELKSSASLLGSYAKPVLLQIQLKSEIKKPVQRPLRIALPNSIFSAGGEGHNICLFVRSEDKAAIEAHLTSEPVEGLDKVLSINDVKKLYTPHKERKALLSQYTHFICDSRIVGHLYNLLGKVFSARHNLPVPIEYKNETKIAKAVALFKESTYMHLSGSNISIRFGHTKQSADEILKNVKVGLQYAVTKIPNEWKEVHSIHLKSSDSPALPVYSKVSTDEMKFVQKELGKVKEVVASSSVSTVTSASSSALPAKKSKKTK